MNEQLAQAGGLLFLLTFFHFLADWIPQTHREAVTKSKDWRVRAKHVTVYTALMMVPFTLILWHHRANTFFIYYHISFVVTWVTHFIGDSYVITFAWVKYIRQIPEELRTPKDPLTLILVIVIDQLWHIAWLCVPVALAVWG